MSDLILKKVRTTQPQQAVGIDWSNPITRGLVAASTPNTRTYINGGAVLPSTATVGAIIYADNEVLRQYVYRSPMPALKNAPSPTSNLTMLSVFIPGNEIGERGTGQLGQTTAAVSAGISVGDVTSAGKVRFKIYLGGTRYIGSSQADMTRPNVAIARHIYASKQDLWLNGVHDSGVGNFTNAGVGYGFYGHAAPSGLTALSLNVVWHRALTDSEIKSLSENPWQIFLPERRVLSFDSVITGGDVSFIFSSRQLQSIASNNARSLYSFAATKTAQSTTESSSNSLSSIILTKQTQTTQSALSRFIQSAIATKEINSSNSVYDLTVSGSFSSQTKQGQSSHYGRVIQSNIATKAIQQTVIILGRSVTFQALTKSVQKLQSSFNLTLDSSFSNYQKQAQSNQSAYSRSINISFLSKQGQKLRFISDNVVVNPIVTIPVRQLGIPIENRYDTILIESRGYII